MSVLNEAWIKFHTNDEDKDSDTDVSVKYFDRNDNLVAETRSHTIYGIRFSEGDDFGPYKVDTVGTCSISTVDRHEILEGKVIIEINPHGNDTWRFNFSPIFKFNDGSFMSTINGIELSEDNKWLTYDFGKNNTIWYSVRDIKPDLAEV
jgi:hypothetical protein